MLESKWVTIIHKIFSKNQEMRMAELAVMLLHYQIQNVHHIQEAVVNKLII